jgi:regulator of sirC expression with transglutaminase-like and TPR domain
LAREAASQSEWLDIGHLDAWASMLSGLLLVDFGYHGDSDTYDDLANANLIQVIKRRRGLPVALGILWIHAALAAGVPAGGVNFPGHFLVRLGEADSKLLIDVFGGGHVLDAAGLESLLHGVYGRHVRLEPSMLAEMSPREVLLRLQGNIVSRLERGGQRGKALSTLGDMQRIAPRAAHLWLDEARLRQESEDPAGMYAALGHFLSLEPNGVTADRVRLALHELRGRMN